LPEETVDVSIPQALKRALVEAGYQVDATSTTGSAFSLALILLRRISC